MDYIEQINSFIPCNEQEHSDQLLIKKWIAQYPHNILLRDNEMAHITSSGLIMNPDLTHMLMVHHNIYNTWTWTGGHADGQRDLLQIAIKEAKEETGLQQVTAYCDQMLSLDILPVYGHIKKQRYISAHLHLSAAYLLIADDTAPLAVCPSENSAVKWVPWQQEPEYSNEPFMVVIFQKMIQRIKHEEN